MINHVLLRVVAKLLIPLIMLFALYVQFHGEYSPGGGFQAGVIFAAAFILYGLIFGLQAVKSVAPAGVIRVLMALGVLIFAGTGLLSIMAGGNYLDYNVLAADPVAGQHLGILLIEIGVGVTVASAMIMIYYTFSGRHPLNQDE